MSNIKIKNQIWIEADMFYSDAFNCLSTSAIKILMRCLQKRKWEKTKVKGKKQTVYTNEGFIFPYEEARKLNICGNTQFYANIKKLIEVGFLEIIHQGGWYQKHEKEKDYNVYKLSDRWRKYGTSEFEKVEKPKVLPESFYIRKNIDRKKLKSTSQKRSGQLHESEDDSSILDNNCLHESEVEEIVLKSTEGITVLTQ